MTTHHGREKRPTAINIYIIINVMFVINNINIMFNKTNKSIIFNIIIIIIIIIIKCVRVGHMRYRCTG